MSNLKGKLTPVGTLNGQLSVGGGGTSDYNELENKPSINNVELSGDKTASDLGFAPVATSGDYNDLENKPTIPTKTSELDNDSGFANSSIVANPYDATSTYAVGAYVTHENNLYKCNTAIDTAEEWNAEHWTLVDVISAIPTKTSDLDNDSNFASIDDNSTANNKAWSSSKITDEIINILPIGTASGSVASFNTSLALPLVSAKFAVNASQESGTPTPSTPKAISGWNAVNLTHCGANLCNQADIVNAYPTKYTVDTDGSIKTVGNLGLSDVLWTNKSNVSGVLNVVFVSKYQNTGSFGIRPKIIYTDGTNSVIYTTNTQDYSTRTLLTTSGKTVEKIVVDYGTNNPTNFFLEVTLDTSASTYEAYNGSTEVINLGDTCYGGEITQDKDGHRQFTNNFSSLVNLNSFDWYKTTVGGKPCFFTDLPSGKKSPSEYIGGKCSTYTQTTSGSLPNDLTCKFYSSEQWNFSRIAIRDDSASGLTAEEFKSYVSGSMCYEIATPTTTDLPDGTITNHIGTNNIFADSGNSEVVYKKSINDAIAELQALFLS